MSLDVDGEAYDILSPSLAEIEVSENGWRSMTELQSPRYAPIDLLSIRTSELFNYKSRERSAE